MRAISVRCLTYYHYHAGVCSIVCSGARPVIRSDCDLLSFVLSGFLLRLCLYLLRWERILLLALVCPLCGFFVLVDAWSCLMYRRAGVFSDVGQTNCTQCPDGSFSLFDEANCPESSSRGPSSCSPCPPGNACPFTSSPPVPCAPGSFSLGGQTHCTQCENGSFAAEENSTYCEPCPSGSACTMGASAPVPCAAGFFSKSSAEECTGCAEGMYSVCNSTACITTPSGTACKAECSRPELCPAGTFAEAGARECTPCEAGLFSEAGEGRCHPCPPGSQCSFGLSPQPCFPGTFAPANSTNCSLCPAGHYANDSRASVCFPCPEGTFLSIFVRSWKDVIP